MSLVAILDADKEGFLRSEKKLIQTIGRAARNVSGEVHMYADSVTDSMTAAIDETNRRREKQVAYNLANGIDPQPIRKKIADITDMLAREDVDTDDLLGGRQRRGRAPVVTRGEGDDCAGAEAGGTSSRRSRRSRSRADDSNACRGSRSAVRTRGPVAR